MAFSDPLLKELKVSFQPLMHLTTIRDDSKSLELFCRNVERILYQGLQHRAERDVPPQPWLWLNAVSFEMEKGNIPRVFSYVRSVEETRQCEKIRTEQGKLRQLLRCCLKYKCLHIPIEAMVRQIGDRKLSWYQPTSVLGHDVLGEIFLSVLMQASQLNFTLDTKNARCLDLSWELPECMTLTCVPCEKLGMVITYSHDMAVIVDLHKGGVAAEERKIELGDILDELNGRAVTLALRGKLKGMLNTSRPEPIDLRVIKIHTADPQRAYTPCVRLYRREDRLAALCNADTVLQQPTCAKDLKYLGKIVVGRRGDVSQVEEAVKNVLSDPLRMQPRACTVECREIHVVVSGDQLLMKHSYVTIASCGHSVNHPQHFAYIVGDGPCSTSTEYTCHVFKAASHAACSSILLDISSGFDRTHCSA